MKWPTRKIKGRCGYCRPPKKEILEEKAQVEHTNWTKYVGSCNDELIELVDCRQCDLTHRLSCYDLAGGCSEKLCPFARKRRKSLLLCARCDIPGTDVTMSGLPYHRSCAEAEVQELYDQLDQDRDRAVRRIWRNAFRFTCLSWIIITVVFLFLHLFTDL